MAVRRHLFGTTTGSPRTRERRPIRHELHWGWGVPDGASRRVTRAIGDTPPNLNRPGDGPLLRARGLHKPVAMMIDGVDSVGEVRTVRRVGAGRRVQSEIVVARRYLEHGFVDAAMRIFGRHAAQVAADDWNLLVDRLLERGRVADAVGVCRTGDIPLPKEKLLDLGDRQLRR